jgi:hypothetical protein
MKLTFVRSNFAGLKDFDANIDVSELKMPLVNPDMIRNEVPKNYNRLNSSWPSFYLVEGVKAFVHKVTQKAPYDRIVIKVSPNHQNTVEDFVTDFSQVVYVNYPFKV